MAISGLEASEALGIFTAFGFLGIITGIVYNLTAKLISEVEFEFAKKRILSNI